MDVKQEPIEYSAHGEVFEPPKQDMRDLRGSTDRNEIMPSGRAAPLNERSSIEARAARDRERSRDLSLMELEAERKRKEIDASRLRDRQHAEDELLAARRDARYREEERIQARWEGDRDPKNGLRLASHASPPYGARASGSAYAASPDLYESERRLDRSYHDDPRYDRSTERSIDASYSRSHADDLDAARIVKELQDEVRRMAKRVKEVEMAEAAKEIELKDSENIQRELRKRVKILELEMEALREASRERFEAVEARTDGIHDGSRILLEEVKQLKSLHASASKGIVERDEHEYYKSSRYKAEDGDRSHRSAVSPARTERGRDRDRDRERERDAEGSSSRRSRGYDSTRRDSPEPRASKRQRASIDDAPRSLPEPLPPPTIKWGEPVELQATPLQGGEEFTCIVRAIKSLVSRQHSSSPQPVRFSALAALLLNNDPSILSHFRVPAAKDLIPLCQKFVAMDAGLSFKSNGQLDTGGETLTLRDFTKPYTQCLIDNVPSFGAQIAELRRKLDPANAASIAKTGRIQSAQHAAASGSSSRRPDAGSASLLSQPSAFYNLCDVLRRDKGAGDRSMSMKTVCDELAVHTGPATFKETLRQVRGFYAFIAQACEFVKLERCGEDGKSLKLHDYDAPFLDPAVNYAYLERANEWAARQVAVLDEDGQPVDQRVPTPPETDHVTPASPDKSKQLPNGNASGKTKAKGVRAAKTLRRNSDGELSFSSESDDAGPSMRSK